VRFSAARRLGVEGSTAGLKQPETAEAGQDHQRSESNRGEDKAKLEYSGDHVEPRSSSDDAVWVACWHCLHGVPLYESTTAGARLERPVVAQWTYADAERPRGSAAWSELLAAGLLMIAEGLEDEFAHSVLCRGVEDWAQQGKTPALAVD
jgi:hypothetical protein